MKPSTRSKTLVISNEEIWDWAIKEALATGWTFSRFVRHALKQLKLRVEQDHLDRAPTEMK